MTRRLRVLSVIGQFGFGGGENRVLALARSVDSERFEHSVAILKRPDDSEGYAMRAAYEKAGVSIYEIEEQSFRKAPPMWCKARRLSQRVAGLCGLIRRLNADVIDAHMESAALTGSMAGLMTRRPTCVTLYHAQPLRPTRFWGAAAQFILGRADLVITDSAVRSREIAYMAKLRRPNLLVIPNGVWVPQPVRPVDEMKSSLGIPIDPRVKVIGQISGLAEFKGHGVLIEAAKEVLRIRPETYFVITGYGAEDDRKRIERRIADLGVASHFRLISYPGPIGDIWSILDIHVHASLFDSLPNAILEGMSLAKPAVVTAVGGVPDAVAHRRSGLVVPPGDVPALSSALLELLNDEHLAAGLGKAALDRYQQTYRPDLVARRLESCFVGMAARHHRAGL